MQANGGCGLERLASSLLTFDTIEEDHKFTNCTKVKCIYDLLDESNNGLFCSTFGALFDSDNFNLVLSTGNRFSDLDGGDGETGFNGNEITILIADDICNGTEHPLDIAGILLHEAIHASMYQYALLSNPELTEDNYCSIWQSYFSTNDPCHEIMANQYVYLLAQALSDLDTNNYPIDYYLYIAWSGLNKVGEKLGIITDQYKNPYIHNI